MFSVKAFSLFCSEDLRQELVILSFGKAEMLPNQIMFRAPKRNKFLNTVDSLLRDPTSHLGSLSKLGQTNTLEISLHKEVCSSVSPNFTESLVAKQRDVCSHRHAKLPATSDPVTDGQWIAVRDRRLQYLF